MQPGFIGTGDTCRGGLEIRIGARMSSK